MLKIHAPSTTVRVGDIVQLPLTCTEPGDVVITSSDESVAVVSTPVTIADAGPYVPLFDPFYYVAEYGVRGQFYGIPYIGCMTPEVENFACLNVLPDNTRRFSLAVRLKIYQWVTTDPIIGVGPLTGTTYSHMMLITSSGNQLLFYYYTTAGGSKSVNTSALLVNDSNWYDYVFNVFFDRNTNTGYVEGWRNGVYTAKSTTMIDGTWEPGYFLAGAFSKFLICPSTKKLEIRDVYVSNDTLWTQTEVDAYHAGTVIDSSKYTLHWPCEKNTELPYYIENDTKNNMPLSFNGPPSYVTWVPKTPPADPYNPYTSIPISPLSSGDTTITATHPNGEVDTYLLTVEDALVVEQATVQLMIYASIAGTATIAMDNPIIDFPASVAVVEGQNQISGTVIGSGTCNVTVTLDGQSSVTQFIVDEITTVIAAGPPQTIRARL